MRYLFGFMCVLALGVMGCGETTGTGGSGGEGGVGGVGGDGGSGGAGEIGTLQVLPMELDADGEQVPLVGVSVCEVDTTNCAVSDGLVFVELQVPANQEISYTQTKDGFDSRLRSDIIPMPPKLTIVVPVMEPTAQVAEQFERLMSPYPMVDTGAVSVLVWGGTAGDPIPGATLELVDGTGKPYYANDDGTWHGDLTATTMEGSGGFVEVDPGEVEVRVGGAAKNCEVLRGWPGTEENSIRMAVREGFRTSARLLCSR
jgi:hypothetical protein